MSYEQAVDELSRVVSNMERSDATLEELLKLYEEGSRLAVFCAKKLDDAKKRAAEIAGALSAEAEI
ncbi:MAG: exodeoxyribonuclease VII small subunit [Clostridia bacterium]|nr:exodeoxyribonuclease VII small subunit [Clostridia bacterium]MBR5428828.1 exodeoxyribonuclease VII small subunit [Clostridia bacterium]